MTSTVSSRFALRSMLILALALGAALSSAKADSSSGTNAKAAFSRMKSLAGDWSGPKMMGHKMNINYRVIASGSAVMETVFAGTPMEMVTIYYPVGDSLVQTHYCMMGNQPHLKLNAKKSSADTLVFQFAGGDNIKTTKGNMHNTTLHFMGKNRVESTCEGEQNGKPAETHKMVMVRA